MAHAFLGYFSRVHPRALIAAGRELERRRAAAKRKVTVPATGDILTRKQAGIFLGYDAEAAEDAVRGLVRHGHLKLGVHYFKPTARVLRFKRSALERWLTSPARPEPETKLSDDELREQLAEAAKQIAKEKR